MHGWWGGLTKKYICYIFVHIFLRESTILCWLFFITKTIVHMLHHKLSNLEICINYSVSPKLWSICFTISWASSHGNHLCYLLCNHMLGSQLYTLWIEMLGVLYIIYWKHSHHERDIDSPVFGTYRKEFHISKMYHCTVYLYN